MGVHFQLLRSSYVLSVSPPPPPHYLRDIKVLPYLVNSTTLFGQLFALADAGHLLALKLAALSRQQAPALTQHLLQVEVVEAELHLLLLRLVNRLCSVPRFCFDLRFCLDLRLCLDLRVGSIRLDSVRLPDGHIPQDMLDSLKSKQNLWILNPFDKIHDTITSYRYWFITNFRVQYTNNKAKLNKKHETTFLSVHHVSKLIHNRNLEFSTNLCFALGLDLDLALTQKFKICLKKYLVRICNKVRMILHVLPEPDTRSKLKRIRILWSNWLPHWIKIYYVPELLPV